jgi:preprotein translocase subunit SecE
MKLFDKGTKFVTEVRQEMSKVSWPNWTELKSSTIMVLIISLLFSVYIFVIDQALTFAIRLIFGTN